MSSKSKRKSSNLSLMPLFGEEHKRVPSLGPEIVFWTRTKKPKVTINNALLPVHVRVWLNNYYYPSSIPFL